MKFPEYLKSYKQNINEAIKQIFKKKIKQLNNSFLKDYYTELKDYFLVGGKRIRPLLCIASYNAFRKQHDDKVIPISVGIEFLHNASLIHDDIIDKDDYRRGNPSFHFRFKNYHKSYNFKKTNDVDFGNSIGIIGGDTAFFLGLEAYLFNDFEKEINNKAISLYEQAFIDIANGVLIEMDMVNKEKIEMAEYIEMISLKTSALIEKSLLIGANYSQMDKALEKSLSTYGINLGIVFQIIDDILGTFGDEKVTGKPTDGDIREGKKTCLLIEALNKLDSNKKSQLENIVNKSDISNEDVEIVKNLFIDADVINSSKKLAETYYQKAKLALDSLSDYINPQEFEFFDDLLNFVMNRTY
ncbi:MAG: polyprenyl synthetase family protein [Promethearchaeota archaeon]